MYSRREQVLVVHVEPVPVELRRVRSAHVHQQQLRTIERCDRLANSFRHPLATIHERIERQLVPALKQAGASGIITYGLNKVIP